MSKVTVRARPRGAGGVRVAREPARGGRRPVGSRIYSSKDPGATAGRVGQHRGHAQLYERRVAVEPFGSPAGRVGPNWEGQVMPAWGKQLSDAQITALVGHVRSLKK